MAGCLTPDGGGQSEVGRTETSQWDSSGRGTKEETMTSATIVTIGRRVAAFAAAAVWLR